jgi:hypothetical protein
MMIISSIAHCDQFSRFEYECKHLDAKQHGVTCKITPDRIRGSYLWLKNHTTIHDTKDRREKASYIKDTIIHNYMVVGGTGIYVWVQNPKGVAVQRYCGKLKGEMEVFCQDWAEIPPDEKLNWE